ncbi:MAG: hypothetical protein HY332_25225 [Chloroflexi bacterium]|nr:hypothetical protein [Chloroflexota bacterium]
MANRWVGAAAGLIGGQVAGRVLAVFLNSSAGERLMATVDRRHLTPLEHRVLVVRWSGNIGKALSAAAAALAVLWGGEPERGVRLSRSQMGRREIDWVQVLQRTAEMMLALGAIFKVVGEFLEDRQKTAAETERAAAKRLA